MSRKWADKAVLREQRTLPLFVSGLRSFSRHVCFVPSTDYRIDIASPMPTKEELPKKIIVSFFFSSRKERINMSMVQLTFFFFQLQRDGNEKVCVMAPEVVVCGGDIR